MATFEEARACPRCAVPGVIGHMKSIPRSKDQLVQLTCHNARCKWHNTSWTVQRRPDGTVPDPDPRGRIKDYPAPGTIVQANMEDLARLLEAQQQPGGAEI